MRFYRFDWPSPAFGGTGPEAERLSERTMDAWLGPL